MKPIRLGVAGAGRGQTFMRVAPTLNGRVEVQAICDIHEPTLRSIGETMPGVRQYVEFEKMLEDPDLDAICIATPVMQHAAQAVAALGADKHVLCEVPAAYSMEECYAVRDAARASNRTYMMAENYCFTEPALTVQEMVDKGVFGDIIQADCAYLHDCRNLMFNADGSKTWRGERRSTSFGNTYPTHSIGPVSRWLGLGVRDEMESMVAMGSGTFAVEDYAARNFPDMPQLQHGWRTPDSVTVLIRTKLGALIEHRFDASSPRPHNMMRYALQGTKASVSSPVDAHDDWYVWMQDRSETNPQGIAGGWDRLAQYKPEFKPSLWKEEGELARQSGHGGGDYFVLREFADSIREGRKPLIDVYDAVSWSSIIPLSEDSISSGGVVKFVDFRKG